MPGAGSAVVPVAGPLGVTVGAAGGAVVGGADSGRSFSSVVHWYRFGAYGPGPPRRTVWSPAPAELAENVQTICESATGVRSSGCRLSRSVPAGSPS
ncbi:hypothetical protein R1T08_28165 [Streptomyces sp. SBC-4]|nr:hypothetical protein [Streptomyces sp. SBC-4]MDV5147942.1 hypothetical protein [Streptomyces sp. SBC-4]